MYDFLKNFHLRMRNISSSALLYKSVVYKDTLNTIYGFKEYDEQLNLIYMLLLYIMHQSLKEEECTLDDMALYLEDINEMYFRKDINKEDYVKLANFIVNEIVLNDGNMTFFNCLNTEKEEFNQVYVQLIGHKRTVESNMATYYLTEDGYNLVLSSFEFEDNMKLTVHELVFKLNLENKDYDKALSDVKNIFALSKKQVQSLLDNIVRIKENVMNFTSDEYERSIFESIKVIKEQDEKFKAHIEEIEKRKRDLQELYAQNELTNNRKEEMEIEDKLDKLGKIKRELDRIAYEHSRIMNVHYEFKEAYTNALLSSAENSRRERIDVKELEDRILRDLSQLELMDYMLQPLYKKQVPKTYNLINCLMPQKSRIIQDEESEEVSLVMDEEAYLLEKEEKLRKAKEKLAKYKGVVKTIIECCLDKNERCSLKEIVSYAKDKNIYDELVPNVYMLREVLLELLTLKEFTIEKLKKDIRKTNKETSNEESFEPLKIILELVDENNSFKMIDSMKIIKPEDKGDIIIVENKDEPSKPLNGVNLQFEITLKEFAEMKFKI